jgi:hypothetical protein
MKQLFLTAGVILTFIGGIIVLSCSYAGHTNPPDWAWILLLGGVVFICLFIEAVWGSLPYRPSMSKIIHKETPATAYLPKVQGR